MNICEISHLNTLAQQVSRDQKAGYADGDLQAEVAKLQKASRDSKGLEHRPVDSASGKRDRDGDYNFNQIHIN